MRSGGVSSCADSFTRPTSGRGPYHFFCVILILPGTPAALRSSASSAFILTTRKSARVLRSSCDGIIPLTFSVASSGIAPPASQQTDQPLVPRTAESELDQTVEDDVHRLLVGGAAAVCSARIGPA